MTAIDRLAVLLDKKVVTGIKRVAYDRAARQVVVDLHVSRADVDLAAPVLDPDRITISHRANPAERVTVTGVDLPPDLLQLHLAADGSRADQGSWLLEIDDVRFDHQFRTATLTFHDHCPTDVDCRPLPAAEAAPPARSPSLDQIARDYRGLRRLLLDYANQRSPGWQDRLAADTGVMLVELMAHVGDEMAYYQDRVAREAHLETATQRRSVRRHARLVDYRLHDGRGAGTLIQVTAVDGASGRLPAGMALWASDDDGVRVGYELGPNLAAFIAGDDYQVRGEWNAFPVHRWDEDHLEIAGEVHQLTVRMPAATAGPLANAVNNAGDGKWMVIAALTDNPAQPLRRHPVRVRELAVDVDPLQDDPPARQIAHLRWDPAQSLPWPLPVAGTSVHANVLPASAGERVATWPDGTPARFIIHPSDPHQPLAAAVERTGPTRVDADGRPRVATRYLFSLPGSDERGVVRHGADLRHTAPEIALRSADGVSWRWRDAMIGTDSAEPTDPVFVLEDGLWAVIASFDHDGARVLHADYRGNQGQTVAFGDGEFGRIPPADTEFEVVYRLGNGSAGNVAADTLTGFDPAHPVVLAGVPGHRAGELVTALTNPLAAAGGVDPEPIGEARRRAPEAFRHEVLRAVTPADFERVAGALAGVQRAGARRRWTGSWHTTFVTPDPIGGTVVSEHLRAELEAAVDRYRVAGRAVRVRDPRYADLDLRITLCLQTGHDPSRVKQEIGRALFGKRAFFDADNFSFGSPLWRSALDAAVQGVAGVARVTRVDFRHRGVTPWRRFSALAYPVADNEILRIANDPSAPEHGSVEIHIEGGA